MEFPGDEDMAADCTGLIAHSLNRMLLNIFSGNPPEAHLVRLSWCAIIIPISQKEVIMDENKVKALGAALAQIEKQFGKGAIMKMGDAQIDQGIQSVSTGSLGLDMALGIGGLPRGRVVEIYGPESSGKTTLTLQVIAAAQRAGGTAAFIDAEHALDPIYAGKLGVDVPNLIISQPDTGEQGLEIADMLVRSGGVDIIAAQVPVLFVAEVITLWCPHGVGKGWH
jgi:hypothetical protein